MQFFNKFEVYSPNEFILSETFSGYSIESQSLISDLLIKIHAEKVNVNGKLKG